MAMIVKSLITLALMALSMAAQDTPAPLNKTEKTAIGTQLQRRQALLAQLQDIQRQIQEIDTTTNEIVNEAYAGRKIESKDWVIKSDLSGWTKPESPKENASAKPASVKATAKPEAAK